LDPFGSIGYMGLSEDEVYPHMAILNRDNDDNPMDLEAVPLNFQTMKPIKYPLVI